MCVCVFILVILYVIVCAFLFNFDSVVVCIQAAECVFLFYLLGFAFFFKESFYFWEEMKLGFFGWWDCSWVLILFMKGKLGIK